jgi:uncharacterized membrane protein
VSPDPKSKSVKKAIMWRVIATVVTASLVLAVTGELTIAGTVGALDAGIKMVAYYFHERWWSGR